jgi:thioredoxin 1
LRARFEKRANPRHRVVRHPAFRPERPVPDPAPQIKTALNSGRCGRTPEETKLPTPTGSVNATEALDCYAAEFTLPRRAAQKNGGNMADLDEVTDQNFEAEVLQADTPAIVDFWAEWCAPCRAISPIIQELADSYQGKVKIVKMNVDENPATPAKYGVRAIPTILAIRDGKVVEQMTGARPKTAFQEMAEKLLA